MCSTEEIQDFINDHEEELQEYFCNRYFSCPARSNLNSILDALENYVEDLHKELYIYSKNSKARTVEDVYSDLTNILSIAS